MKIQLHYSREAHQDIFKSGVKLAKQGKSSQMFCYIEICSLLVRAATIQTLAKSLLWIQSAADHDRSKHNYIHCRVELPQHVQHWMKEETKNEWMNFEWNCPSIRFSLFLEKQKIKTLFYCYYENIVAILVLMSLKKQAAMS